VKRVHPSIDERVGSQRIMIQDLDRWRRTSIQRSYRSRRRERRSNHRWSSKDIDHREEPSHMEVTIHAFHTHPWVLEERVAHICRLEKGKAWKSVG
jgi:hypothetical protein